MGDSTAVGEDSIVQQFKSSGKTVGFLGDDFWVTLFGNLFDDSWVSHSYDVVDLDSNDEGIGQHLNDYLDRFDVNIFHFLGVDHSMHSFNQYHPEVDRKIKDVD